VIFALWALQQVELDEARQVAQIDVALAPDALELRLVAQLHLEPVHGNEIDCSPFGLITAVGFPAT